MAALFPPWRTRYKSCLWYLLIGNYSNPKLVVGKYYIAFPVYDWEREIYKSCIFEFLNLANL